MGTYGQDERMVLAVERIARSLEPDHVEKLAQERARLLDLALEETKRWRYRNIAFDGMDMILTPVVGLGTVERLLYKLFVDERGFDHVRTNAAPASGEKLREDVHDDDTTAGG